MEQTHTAKGGEVMYISCMDDEHLINTIKMYTNKIQSLNGTKMPTTRIDKALYGRVINEEKVVRQIQSMIANLPAYVFEACIRGLDIKEYLQKALGRASQNNNMALSYEEEEESIY